jgi:dihydroflavonol-4-reductase
MAEKSKAESKKPAKTGGAVKKKAATPDPSPANGTRALVRRGGSTILVTGGTGFLGSHLVRQLVEADLGPVRVMASRMPQWIRDLGVEECVGSVTEPDDVRRAVEGVDRIFHLAGRVDRDDSKPRPMYALHVEGTRLLCGAAREAKVKTFVLASSSGTVAVTRDGEEIPDEDYPQPLDIIARWPYYASKYYQERTALAEFKGDNRRLVLVNPSLLLGPGDDRLTSTQVVLDFMARKIPSTPGGGLSFCDARDVATAFIAAMEKGRHGERYLLGSANWTFPEFFGRLSRLAKVDPPRLALPGKVAVAGAKLLGAFYADRKAASPVQTGAVEMAEFFWYLNASKAVRELGFDPRDPAVTLNDTVRYVRENFLGAGAF